MDSHVHHLLNQETMYHLHTSALEFGDNAFQYISSKNFAAGATQDSTRLRAIADLSFDLLSQVQKQEKLFKLQQLSRTEEMEFSSNLRLVGIMIHILHEYKYQDVEMMDALTRRYQKFTGSTQSAAA
jgi:hypothetical protein